MISATALVLSFLESVIPMASFMPPGAKAGFSNVATMFAAVSLGFPAAACVTLIKALFAGVTRGFTAMCMSFCGGMLSTVAMYLMFRFSKAGYMLIGIVSALFHNLGQLLVACVLVGNSAVIGYAPVLLVSGIVTGAVTGTVLRAVVPRLDRITKDIKQGGE